MSDSYVIVTGAAGGIGRAVTGLLCQQGHRVVAVDDDAAGLGSLCSGDASVATVANNLTDSEQLAADLTRILGDERRVAGLVNSAARYERGAFDEAETQIHWDATIAGVLGTVEVATRAVLPTLLRQGSGSIVNLASINGLVASPRMAAYTAAKGAVHALTRQLAVEYGPHGIRVNSVSPGLIDTSTIPTPTDPTDRELRVEPYPLSRLGRPDDVAEAVTFLLSDRAAFITGVDLPVDGGLVVTSPAAVVTTSQRTDWHRRPLTYRQT